MAADNAFIDTSTECAICLNTLDDDGSDEEEKTITLSCGHRWHLDCLKEQLENARPSKSKRLLFSGCRCAKCGTFCDHPELKKLTRCTDILREKVDKLIVEQLKIDTPDTWRDAIANNDIDSKKRHVDEGRRSYAFYLCGGCDEPYFGGTIECADEVEGELTTSEDTLCQTCSPKSQVVCQHTFEHRPYHVWKCRYCCKPSSFVCYGGVHFCPSCHERNSKRARNGSNERPKLEGIPCKGENCPFPKPEGRDTHLNGSALQCEQVYYCASCDSSNNIIVESLGSRNLIINPSGEDGLRGWQTHNSPHSRCRWTVEEVEVPVDDRTTTNFVSSYQWCTMYQKVPLYQYARDPSVVRLEISAKIMARTDCPSFFRMQVVVLNSQGRTVHQTSTSQLDAPLIWEKVSLQIDPIPGAHEVIMVVHGKDSRFWQGNYGSKVCHCSVRVLGTEEELQHILIPEQNNFQDAPERRHYHPPNYLRGRAFDILLPVLLIIFFWLISE